MGFKKIVMYFSDKNIDVPFMIIATLALSSRPQRRSLSTNHLCSSLCPYILDFDLYCLFCLCEEEDCAIWVVCRRAPAAGTISLYYFCFGHLLVHIL